MKRYEVKMNLSAGWKWFIGPGLVLIFFSANAEAQTSKATASLSAAPAPSAHHGDADIQQKRLAFVKNATAIGFISGIEDTSPVTRVKVGEKFISLPSGEQEDILNVVWAYYKTEDPKKNAVLVIDQKSGKEIGEYSPAQGGLKMSSEIRGQGAGIREQGGVLPRQNHSRTGPDDRADSN